MNLKEIERVEGAGRGSETERRVAAEVVLMDAEDLARYLRVKISKVRAMVFRDEIPVIRIGRLVRFERQAINGWLDSLKGSASSQANRGHGRKTLSIFEIDTPFSKAKPKGFSHD